MKYKYVGEQPALLIELNIELQPNDVIETDIPLDNVFLIPVAETKTQTKGEAVN